MSTRVRFKCIDNQTVRGGCDIAFQTVSGENSENEKFFMYIPAGQITLYGVNPAVAEMFVMDKEYYLDIKQTEERVIVDELLENNFKHHPPKQSQIGQYQKIRDAGKELGYILKDSCPESREFSLAMIKLEESVMWANAAIARN